MCHIPFFLIHSHAVLWVFILILHGSFPNCTTHFLVVRNYWICVFSRRHWGAHVPKWQWLYKLHQAIEIIQYMPIPRSYIKFSTKLSMHLTPQRFYFYLWSWAVLKGHIIGDILYFCNLTFNFEFLSDRSSTTIHCNSVRSQFSQSIDLVSCKYKSSLLQFYKDSATVFRMQKNHWLPMGSYFGFFT